MPDKTGRQTAKEKTYIERYAATGDREYAAVKAGYPQPSSAATRLMANPAIREAISVEINRKLDNLVLKSLQLFDRTLDDDKAPLRDKITVGKIVVTAHRNRTDMDQASKDPSELSGDELQRRIARLQGELAERARPVLDLEAQVVDEPAGEAAEDDENGLFD